MTHKVALLGLIAILIACDLISPEGTTYSVSAQEIPLPEKVEIVKAGTMVASHYGKDDGFDGKPTANCHWSKKLEKSVCEKMDKDALTAAHKTLPMGTILIVSNPDNGRWVKVRINDRGPYIKGRHLDLSYAAARRIGIVREGVQEIEYMQLARY